MRLRADRGTTLIEVMIAMVVLLVGLLGLMQLQIFGFTANQGARATMRAQALANDLAATLQRVPYANGVLAANQSGTEDAPPTGAFGSALGGCTGHTSAELTAALVPGIVTDAQLPPDPLNPGQPLFRRCWTVWEDVEATMAASKLIAVSVVYHENRNTTPRETMVYVTVPNPNFGARPIN